MEISWADQVAIIDASGNGELRRQDSRLWWYGLPTRWRNWPLHVECMLILAISWHSRHADLSFHGR